MIRPSFSLWEIVGGKLDPDKRKNAEAIEARATTVIIIPIIALFNDFCSIIRE